MSRPMDGGWHAGRSFHDRRCLFCTALGSDAVVRYGNGCIYSVCSDHPVSAVAWMASPVTRTMYGYCHGCLALADLEGMRDLGWAGPLDEAGMAVLGVLAS